MKIINNTSVFFCVKQKKKYFAFGCLRLFGWEYTRLYTSWMFLHTKWRKTISLKEKKSYCSIYINFWNIMLLDGQDFHCKSLLKSIHSSLTIPIFFYIFPYLFNDFFTIMAKVIHTIYKHFLLFIKKQRVSESKCL